MHILHADTICMTHLLHEILEKIGKEVYTIYYLQNGAWTKLGSNVWLQCFQTESSAILG